MKALFYLPTFLLFTLSLNAQPEGAESRITSLMEEAGIPGLSIAYLENGQLAYSGAFGVRSLDTGLPVDAQTIFSAASLSKPVFAYAVMQLVEKQQLDLDKPLCEYLEYEDIGDDPRYRQITARMVLSHTCGFPNWRGGELELLFEPGERFQYSGEGFVYLQKVVEKITGKGLEEFAREMVFIPLGMTRTSYLWQPRFEDDYAVPHDEMGKTRLKTRYEDSNAAYSLQTTAEDYARFLLALMNGKGLKSQTIDLMLTPRVKVPVFGAEPPRLHEQVSWGLGIGLQQTGEGKEYWHWGDNGTFKCYFTASKERRTGLVYFTNSSNGLSITPEIAALFLETEQPAWAWNRYSHYEAPAFKLLCVVAEKDFDQAIAPFLDPKAGHQDTALIGEREMNNLGYLLLRQKRYGEAKKAFRLNVEAFPHSSNVYDSYAEACLVSGDREGAAKYYAKAAGMDPDNERAKRIADQLAQPAQGKTLFRLESYPNALLVSLAGEFNGWSEFENIMQWKDGAWICRLDLEPGTYKYKFVVDGVWMLDPANPQSEHDGSHHNSVMTVE